MSRVYGVRALHARSRGFVGWMNVALLGTLVGPLPWGQSIGAAEQREVAFAGLQFGSTPSQAAATLKALGFLQMPIAQPHKGYRDDAAYAGRFKNRLALVAMWFTPEHSLEKLNVSFLTEDDEDPVDVFRAVMKEVQAVHGPPLLALEDYDPPYAGGAHVGRVREAIFARKAYIVAIWGGAAGAAGFGMEMVVVNDAINVRLVCESSRWPAEAARRGKEGPRR